MSDTDYYNGKFGSLTHNILEMLSQIEGNVKYAPKETYEDLREMLAFIGKRARKIKKEIGVKDEN